ncbi:MAG: hypothetical protein AB7F64_06910 [Gammaproteobacteria bacterium]
MYTFAEKPLSFGQVISNGVRLWTGNYWQLLILTLLAIVMGTLPHFVLPGLTIVSPQRLLSYLTANYGKLILYLFLSLFIFEIIFYRFYTYASGVKHSILGLIAYSLEKLPYILLGALLFLIVVSCGYVFIFVPGVFLTIALSMLLPLILIDKLNPFAAFKHSFNITTPHWWHTFLVIFFPMIVFQLIAAGIDSTALRIWHTVNGPKPWEYYPLFSLVVNSIYYPLFSSIMVVLLHDLKLRAKDL